MINYGIMLLEASIAMVLFYTVYYFWLRKETFFQLNRLYLLWAIIFSLIVPLINIPLSKSTEQVEVYNLLESISISAQAYEQSFLKQITALQWVTYVYLLGVVVSVFRFLLKLWQIKRIANATISSSQIKVPNYIKFVNADIIPFTFLKRIYINPNLYTEEQLNKIIAHETVHLNQLHTVDGLLYELLIVLFWFNPIAYRYRKSAKELHEYLADEGVMKSGFSAQKYKQLLFKEATGFGELKLANSFNYSLIKRRLVMLTKIKSPKMAKVRVLWVLPVLISVLLVFACNDQETEVIEYYKSTQVGDLTVYDEVEEMPQYPGGDQELRMFIANNIKYPESAKAKGIQGRVFVQFVVDKMGQVGNVTVKRGVNELLDNEAIRVVSALPNWKPGKLSGNAVNVQFTIPINFALGDVKPNYEIIERKDVNGKSKEEKVYFTVDEMPQYPGGDLAIRDFIAANIKYPESAKESGIQGRVFIQFVVMEDGSVGNVKVVRGVEKSLDAEAVRVISALERWVPGKVEGMPVNVSFTVPINFKLN